jgi:hypothetical protein
MANNLIDFGNPLDRALDRLRAEVLNGLRHGYFELVVSCEIISENRRRLTLKTGKSYRFIIPSDDCVRSRDSQDGSANDGDA